LKLKIIKKLKIKDEQILTQIINNTNQIKIYAVLENNDKKINKLLEIDKRTHSLAFHFPKIPEPFILL